MMNVPSEEDWRSEGWNIDTPYAYRNFFGKTLTEAFDLFVESSIYYKSDIMFMPLVCFRYYIHAYIDYLMSEKSAGDSDGASCFFGLVEFRKDDIKASARDLQQRVAETLRHIAARQKWYDADEFIYGDFADRAIEALKQIEN